MRRLNCVLICISIYGLFLEWGVFAKSFRMIKPVKNGTFVTKILPYFVQVCSAAYALTNFCFCGGVLLSPNVNFVLSFQYIGSFINY